MIDREKVIKGLECCMKWTGEPNTATCHCSDCSYTNMDILGERCLIDLINDALALLKDRAKDYEAWAKEIGADTCVNCRHASFNRNDGKSTCPIEHNFALVKDGFCHLFMRIEGR